MIKRRRLKKADDDTWYKQLDKIRKHWGRKKQVEQMWKLTSKGAPLVRETSRVVILETRRVKESGKMSVISVQNSAVVEGNCLCLIIGKQVPTAHCLHSLFYQKTHENPRIIMEDIHTNGIYLVRIIINSKQDVCLISLLIPGQNVCMIILWCL